MKEKIYIDFDGTLYNSDKFYTDFLEIYANYNISKDIVENEMAKLFATNHLFNPTLLSKHLCQKYHLPKTITQKVEELYHIPNLYVDVLEGLELIKQTNKYEINILTYGQLDHQTKKIKFSKAMTYINNIIVTSNSKIGLKEIDYQNSIFIDNNPNQIEQLVKYGVKKIFRIRRATDKYSTQKVSNNIKEYPDFLTLVKKELI